MKTIIVGIGKWIFSNTAFKHSLSKTYNTSLPGAYSAGIQGRITRWLAKPSVMTTQYTNPFAVEYSHLPNGLTFTLFHSKLTTV